MSNFKSLNDEAYIPFLYDLKHYKMILKDSGSLNITTKNSENLTRNAQIIYASFFRSTELVIYIKLKGQKTATINSLHI